MIAGRYSYAPFIHGLDQGGDRRALTLRYGAQIVQDRKGMVIGLPAVLGGAELAGCAEDAATGASGLQAFLSAEADHFPFVFCEGGEHVDHQPVRMGVVASDEIHAAFHHAGDEMDIPGQSVEFGDDERCPSLASEPDRVGELGSVLPLPAFHFDIFRDAGATGQHSQIGGDGELLGIEAEAAFALPCC